MIRKMMMRKENQQLLLTMFQLTPNVESTKELPDNQPTTVIILTQLPMLSETNSLTPTLVSANGGKSNSLNNT
jgi:hypothetical protein